MSTSSVPTLDEVTAAVRAAWCRETCDDGDLADRTPANPAGRALVNRLPDGTEVDLTRGQFAPGEVVQEPRVVIRPPGLPRRGAAQYLRLRDAVRAALGPAGPAPA